MKIFNVCIALILCLGLLSACSVPSDDNDKETEIIQATFTDVDGNLLEIYIIKTTYVTEPASLTGLDVSAFRAVFDVDNAALLKEFDASGHAAAIYRGESCNYICCTTSPTASVVMSYDPDAVSEEDMIRSARSIYDGA